MFNRQEYVNWLHGVARHEKHNLQINNNVPAIRQEKELIKIDEIIALNEIGPAGAHLAKAPLRAALSGLGGLFRKRAASGVGAKVGQVAAKRTASGVGAKVGQVASKAPKPGVRATPTLLDRLKKGVKKFGTEFGAIAAKSRERSAGYYVHGGAKDTRFGLHPHSKDKEILARAAKFKTPSKKPRPPTSAQQSQERLRKLALLKPDVPMLGKRDSGRTPLSRDEVKSGLKRLERDAEKDPRLKATAMAAQKRIGARKGDEVRFRVKQMGQRAEVDPSFAARVRAKQQKIGARR